MNDTEAQLNKLTKAMWIVTSLTVLFPILALPALILAIIVVTRGRIAPGVTAMCLALVLGLVSYSVWTNMLINDEINAAEQEQVESEQPDLDPCDPLPNDPSFTVGDDLDGDGNVDDDEAAQRIGKSCSEP